MATEKTSSEYKSELLTQIIKKLSELTDSGISQNDIAKRWGVSPATLVNLKDTAKWHLLSDKMTRQLVAASHILRHKIYDTNNYATGIALVEDARRNHRFLAWAGLTGGGKTTCLQKMSDQPNTFYVKVIVGMSAVDLLEAICVKMDIEVSKKKQAIMITNIANKLNKLGNGLLMIDDAGKLDGAKKWLAIQELYDATESRAGIIIAGTIQLKKMLEKNQKHDKVGGKELMRRIAFWQGLEHPNEREVGFFCRKYGIEDSKTINYIHKSVNNFGTLRNLLENAQRKADGEPITIDIIRTLDMGDKSIA